MYYATIMWKLQGVSVLVVLNLHYILLTIY